MAVRPHFVGLIAEIACQEWLGATFGLWRAVSAPGTVWAATGGQVPSSRLLRDQEGLCRPAAQRASSGRTAANSPSGRAETK